MLCIAAQPDGSLSFRRRHLGVISMIIVTVFSDYLLSIKGREGIYVGIASMVIVWTCHLVSFSDHSLSLYINTIWSYEILLVDFGILVRAINKRGDAKETSTVPPRN